MVITLIIHNTLSHYSTVTEGKRTYSEGKKRRRRRRKRKRRKRNRRRRRMKMMRLKLPGKKKSRCVHTKLEKKHIAYKSR